MPDRGKLKKLKKHKIHLCALELFSKVGYYKTSMDNIAIKSGVSKGLLYHHYLNKEELFEEVILYSFETILYYFPKNKGVEFNDDSMKYFINSIIVTSLNKNKSYWKLLILLLSEQNLHEISLKYLLKSSAYKEYENVLTNYFLLKGYLKPKIEAKLFTASLLGICIQVIINPTDFPAKPLLFQFANRVLASN